MVPVVLLRLQRVKSMKLKHTLLTPALLVIALAAFGADVTTDYDHHADFGRYHTYSWIGVQANGLWQSRITEAVDSALAAKGWQKVQSGGDAAVSALGRVTEQENFQTFYTGFPGWGWRGWAGM